jgi:hypothetical protein
LLSSARSGREQTGPKGSDGSDSRVVPVRTVVWDQCPGGDFGGDALTDQREPTDGHPAERLVHDRLREALPDKYRLFPTVRWLLREHGHVREGEADLVVAHPEHGFLVIEVKAARFAVTRTAGGQVVAHCRAPHSSKPQTASTRSSASCGSSGLASRSRADRRSRGRASRRRPSVRRRSAWSPRTRRRRRSDPGPAAAPRHSGDRRTCVARCRLRRMGGWRHDEAAR